MEEQKDSKPNAHGVALTINMADAKTTTTKSGVNVKELLMSKGSMLVMGGTGLFGLAKKVFASHGVAEEQASNLAEKLIDGELPASTVDSIAGESSDAGLLQALLKAREENEQPGVVSFEGKIYSTATEEELSALSPDELQTLASDANELQAVMAESDGNVEAEDSFEPIVSDGEADEADEPDAPDNNYSDEEVAAADDEIDIDDAEEVDLDDADADEIDIDDSDEELEIDDAEDAADSEMEIDTTDYTSSDEDYIDESETKDIGESGMDSDNLYADYANDENASDFLS